MTKRGLSYSDFQEWFERNFQNSKEGRAIIAGKEKAEQVEAQAHLDGIEAIKHERDSTLPKLREQEEAARARESKARAAYETANNDHRLAHAAVVNASLGFDQRIHNHRAALARSADPHIAEFLSELRDMLAQDRNLPVVRDSQKFFNPVSGTYVWEEASSFAHLQDHLKAVLAAVNEVTEWKAQGLTSTEVDQRIQRMRARLDQSRQRAHEVVAA